MDKIKELFKPKIVILCNIGYMHLDNFKNYEEYINEKFKLIEHAKIIIANFENQIIRKYNYQDKIVLSYGFNYGDYKALNIKDNEFDFYYQDKLIKHFITILNSKHEILNLLALLAYCHYFNYDFTKLENIIPLIKPYKSRLEIKKINNNIIIDDSYNSNYEGFNYALDILSKYNMKKILIAQGFVELKLYEKKLYQILARKIALVCDFVILVGAKNTKLLKYELDNYNLITITVRNFKEAYKLANSYIKDNKVILIENDLPDIYKRGII